jgi:hypothetical protein
MTALSKDRNTAYREGKEIEFPVITSGEIFAGSLVCLQGSSGYARAATDTSGEQFIGVAQEYVKNTGSSGSKTVRVARTGAFKFALSSGSQAQVGDVMYIVDDQTVAATGTSYSIVAGRLVKYESSTVGWIDISVGCYLATVAASATTIADAGSFTANANVEAALQEIYQHLLSTQSFIGIPLNTLREATTFNVGNGTANGGVLASDTTPILSAINGGTDGCQQLAWAAANVDQVIFQIPLPPDLDDTKNLVLHCRIKSAGTTNAVGFTVESFFDEGDTKISDATDTNQTTTWAEVTATIAHADFPASQTLTIGLTPVTHGTDIMYCSAIWIEYSKKLLTS